MSLAQAIIFVLAINIAALAAGYLMRGLGLHWFIPVIFLLAWVAVLVSRRLVEADGFIMADVSIIDHRLIG
jgi:hypothetical protein